MSDRDQQSVAERANLTPDQWHRLAMDLLVFGFVAGLSLGVLGMLLVWRPW